MSTQPRFGADFSTLNQIPEFAGAWNQIQGQLTNEGASSLEIQAAKDALAQTFSDLTSSSAGFGLSASDALQSAQTYVTAGRTVLGAVTHIQGLISAAQGATDPAPIFKMFTGTLIGVAMAAGALSAGVGAVIVTGVAIALDLLEQVGLFGSKPSGSVIASYGGWTTTTNGPPPNIVLNGAVYSTAPTIPTAHSPSWRRFPDPIRSGDAGWFTKQSNQFQWNGDTWGFPAPDYRAIDQAFPDYNRLFECNAGAATVGAMHDFVQAFGQGWIANKEYDLNGLKSQPDWQVLAHLVRVWNRAHDGSGNQYVDLSQVDLQFIQPPSFSGGNAFSNTGATLVQYCPAIVWPFFMSLIRAVVDNAPDGVTLVGRSIRIHTGPIRIGSATAGPTTTAGKVVGHVSALALGGFAGGLMLSIATGRSANAVFDGAWNILQSWAKDAIGAVEGGVKISTGAAESLGRRRRRRAASKR